MSKKIYIFNDDQRDNNDNRNRILFQDGNPHARFNDTLSVDNAVGSKLTFHWHSMGALQAQSPDRLAANVDAVIYVVRQWEQFNPPPGNFPSNRNRICLLMESDDTGLAGNDNETAALAWAERMKMTVIRCPASRSREKHDTNPIVSGVEEYLTSRETQDEKKEANTTSAINWATASWRSKPAQPANDASNESKSRCTIS